MAHERASEKDRKDALSKLFRAIGDVESAITAVEARDSRMEASAPRHAVDLGRFPVLGK